MPLFNITDAANQAEQNAKAYTDQRVTELLENLYPSSHVHWWGQGKIISGQPFVTTLGTAFAFNRTVFQNPPALLDEVQFEALLAPGNYRLDFLAVRGNNRGIVSFFLNDSLINPPINLYSATTVNNFTASINFSIAKGGRQVFRARVTGKQDISSGYFNSASVIFIDRI